MQARSKKQSGVLALLTTFLLLLDLSLTYFIDQSIHSTGLNDLVGLAYSDVVWDCHRSPFKDTRQGGETCLFPCSNEFQ